MKKKKQYIKPTIKSVEFKAEIGFALSSQRLSSFGSSKEDYNFTTDPQNVNNGNRFGGYFTGNNDDWD